MDVNKKKKVKFVNEDSDTSEEDLNEYKEDYNPFYHCAHCEYKSIFKIEVKEHMEKEHTAHLAESESMIEEEDMMDAIEVWKIYKLLQRMKNK